jgi:DNA recombination protein RmuC
MDILFLFIGLIIGSIVTYFMAQSKFRLENIQTVEELKRRNGELEIKHSSYKDNVDKMLLTMKSEFSYSASDALSKNNTAFLQLAKEVMEKYITQANSGFKSAEKEIEQLILPLNHSLDKNRELVINFEKNSHALISNLKTHLENLSVSQRSLEKETYMLVNALKNPKIRGRWGEIGLKRIVEFSGLNDYCDFQEQVHSEGENKNIRPDLIINLPYGRQIIVDSKVPLNAYLRALETTDADEEKKQLKLHAQAVMIHIQGLSSKEYWKNIEKSADFVILYMEVESSYSAALHEDKELILKAISNKVILATPSTFISVLQSIAYSWKQYKSSENAKEMMQNVQTLHERLKIFSDYFNKLGKTINTVSKQFNQSVNSFETRLLPVVRKIETLGGVSENDELETPNKIEGEASIDE